MFIVFHAARFVRGLVVARGALMVFRASATIRSSTVAIGLIPEDLHKLYEFHEWRHATAIFHHEFASEFRDVMEVLSSFRLRKHTSTLVVAENQRFRTSLTRHYMLANGGSDFSIPRCSLTAWSRMAQTDGFGARQCFLANNPARVQPWAGRIHQLVHA